MSDQSGSAWQSGLARAQQAVGHAQPSGAPLPPPGPQLTGDRRTDRKILKQWARFQRRQMEAASEHPLQGVVMLVAAVALAAAGLGNAAEMWWLLFPAMGVGMRGAKILGARSSMASATPLATTPGVALAPGTPPADARDLRVDGICNKILDELQRSSSLVNELISDPEQTVKTLRSTCRELTRRERDLRSLNSAEDEARLTAEREALTARIDQERDTVVKQRLVSALTALDDQRRQRMELSTAASRLEAEHTRITYSLESLYTQIIRVRSADSASADVAGAGFRRSLEELGSQMTAVADALESVHAGDMSPVAEVSSPVAPELANTVQRQRE